MARALLVSYHFPPSNAVGALRPARLARLLPEFGFHVDVVCGAPSGQVGSVDSSRNRLMPPGAKVVTVETPFVFRRDPTDPPRIGAFPAWAWWKLRAHMEWAVLTRDWAWNWGRAASRAAHAVSAEESFDLLIIDAPPNTAVGPVAQLGKRLGIPTVLDFRDIWWCGEGGIPLWWMASPRHRRSKWAREMRREVIRNAAHVVLSTRDMAEEMTEWFPEVSRTRFSTVTNAFGPVDTEVTPTKALRGAGGGLKLVYTGSLAYGRMAQAQNLIRGMAVLEDQGGPRVEALFVGNGGDELAETAREHSVPHLVEVDGWVEQDQAVELQRGADALLLLQPAGNPETSLAIPGKLFDYMARRRNVLAMTGPGPLADIIKEHDLGVVTSADEPGQIAEALGRLAIRVDEEPVLPLPPAEFSEQNTTASFARILDEVLKG